MSLLILKNLPFFQSVPARDLDLWLRNFQPRVRGYSKGTIIHLQGQEYKDLLFILAGEVSGEIQDYNGKVLKVETLKAPDPIATAVLFAPDTSLPVTAVAKTDTRLLAVPRAEILRLCMINSDFLEKLLADMGLRLTVLAQKIRFLQFGTIRKKLAGYLLDEMRKQRTAVLSVPYTKEVLAEIFGVTRPSLSRVFSDLCREKIISQEGKFVTVKNAAKLREALTAED